MCTQRYIPSKIKEPSLRRGIANLLCIVLFVMCFRRNVSNIKYGGEDGGSREMWMMYSQVMGYALTLLSMCSIDRHDILYVYIETYTRIILFIHNRMTNTYVMDPKRHDNHGVMFHVTPCRPSRPFNAHNAAYSAANIFNLATINPIPNIKHDGIVFPCIFILVISISVWLPNIHAKHIFSSSLNRSIRIHVTTSMLRTIDKHGGLDAYLLNTPDRRIQSEKGVALKREIQGRLGLSRPTRHQIYTSIMQRVKEDQEIQQKLNTLRIQCKPLE